MKIHTRSLLMGIIIGMGVVLSYGAFGGNSVGKYQLVVRNWESPRRNAVSPLIIDTQTGKVKELKGRMGTESCKNKSFYVCWGEEWKE